MKGKTVKSETKPVTQRSSDHWWAAPLVCLVALIVIVTFCITSAKPRNRCFSIKNMQRLQAQIDKDNAAIQDAKYELLWDEWQLHEWQVEARKLIGAEEDVAITEVWMEIPNERRQDWTTTKPDSSEEKPAVLKQDSKGRN